MNLMIQVYYFSPMQNSNFHVWDNNFIKEGGMIAEVYDQRNARQYNYILILKNFLMDFD